MEVEKILETLNGIKGTIDNATRDELFAKMSFISSILDRFYSGNTAYQSDYKYIRDNLSILASGNRDERPFGPNLSKIKALTHQLVDNLIHEINQLGLPSKSDNTMEKTAINIHNNINQSQHQTQTINVNVVLQELKNSLTGKQYNELVEAVKFASNAEEAKPKILEKLLSFGENVCSNILANVITNPNIWNNLLG